MICRLILPSSQLESRAHRKAGYDTSRPTTVALFLLAAFCEVAFFKNLTQSRNPAYEATMCVALFFENKFAKF